VTTDHPDPSELERDVAENRDRIDQTLDAIQGKLTPGQLIDEGLTVLKHDANGLLGSIGQIVRANPLPAALVGVGLVWLLLASASADRPGSTSSPSPPPPD
jgi:hypothetical protein